MPGLLAEHVTMKPEMVRGNGHGNGRSGGGQRAMGGTEDTPRQDMAGQDTVRGPSPNGLVGRDQRGRFTRGNPGRRGSDKPTEAETPPGGMAEAMVAPQGGGDGGRDARGRFSTGNPGGPGNPFGRQAAALRRAAHDVLTPEAVRQVMQVAMQRALAGHEHSIKLVLLYALGKPAAPVDPDTMDQQEWGILKQGQVTASELGQALEGMPLTLARDVVRTAVPAMAQEMRPKVAEMMVTGQMPDFSGENGTNHRGTESTEKTNTRQNRPARGPSWGGDERCRNVEEAGKEMSSEESVDEQECEASIGDGEEECGRAGLAPDVWPTAEDAEALAELLRERGVWSDRGKGGLAIDGSENTANKARRIRKTGTQENAGRHRSGRPACGHDPGVVP